LKDLNDFSIKEDRFFTLSVFMINVFLKKDSNSLIESISLDKINDNPKILEGSVGCVKFSDGKKDIIICLNSEEKAKNLVESYKDFQKCRGGKKIRKTKQSKVLEILKSSCKIF
jgi:hypothetical protein